MPRAARKPDPNLRAELGQYMTPTPVSRFMAGLFSEVSGDMRVLDPGAGAGALTSALVERLCSECTKPRSVSLVCWEVGLALLDDLCRTLKEAERRLEAAGIPAGSLVHSADFLLCQPAGLQSGFLPDQWDDGNGFTHVIMNPPYRKIRSDSEHRAALRRAGIETSNLYTGFMFLAAQLLRPGGEMVAIVPRSFCNGPYFKPFRRQFFSIMTLRHIHVFERRDAAFRDAGVLQENIIIHAVKGAKPAKVEITSSKGAGSELYNLYAGIAFDNMMQWAVDYDTVIRPGDSDKLVRISLPGWHRTDLDGITGFQPSLADLGLEVSTGPVVDFRMRQFLRPQPDGGTAPLLYPAHFQGGRLNWPGATRKPNAIQVVRQTRRWLWPNRGCYVVTRRFSAKEERRRIVASTYRSDLPGDLVGFENHLNVYHVDKIGFSLPLATGLSIYLNSSIVDRYFRQFSGHTQVNAADLRALPYPERKVLERIGAKFGGITLIQTEIDNIIETELGRCR